MGVAAQRLPFVDHDVGVPFLNGQATPVFGQKRQQKGPGWNWSRRQGPVRLRQDNLHVDAVVGGNERTLAVGVAARAHVVADNLKVGALDMALGQLEHLQVQLGDGGEAPAGDEDEGHLVALVEATLQLVAGEVILGRRGAGLGGRGRGGHGEGWFGGAHGFCLVRRVC